jgi:hypothetical protein
MKSMPLPSPDLVSCGFRNSAAIVQPGLSNSPVSEGFASKRIRSQNEIFLKKLKSKANFCKHK